MSSINCIVTSDSANRKKMTDLQHPLVKTKLRKCVQSHNRVFRASMKLKPLTNRQNFRPFITEEMFVLCFGCATLRYA